MKRLLILSGKGGTGKTTIAAAFIRLSETKAAADLDVDAPNLHIIISPESKAEAKPFIGSEKAFINPQKCTGCGKCAEKCRFDAVNEKNGKYSISEYKCEGCGMCAYICPAQAIELKEDIAGTQLLYRSDKVFSTAELKMGRGNSGKLVSCVKLSMLENAPDTPFSVSDGSPGIGCPVISSVSGADLVLIAAEPSESGFSDLKRLVKTAGILDAKTAVCVNKWDISAEYTEKTEKFCRENNIPFTGRIPFDKAAGEAINAGKSIADIDCPAGRAVIEVYKKTLEVLKCE